MKRRLHISLVTETWRPEINGVAMTLGRMADGLLGMGHRITLVRPRQHTADQAGNITDLNEVLVAGCPIPGYRGLRFGLPARRRLVEQWRADRPDVIQVATEGPLGGSAIRAARELNIPVVSEFHTNFHAYSKYYGVGWLEKLVAAHLRRLHNRSEVTLVPTLAVANELTATGYGNIKVVSRGVDTRLFNPIRRSTELRSAWGVTEKSLVVAYIGRLAPEKNLPVVQRSFAEIKAVCPDARLLLVGDGPMRAKLERTAAKGAPDSAASAYIFAGMRRGEDLAAHYASADLFLFPSLTETFGNVTTEGLASGLAVVAYRHAAAAEVITDHYNGRLVAAGDEAAFIATAVALAKDPATMHELRRHTAASVRHLDWEQINDKLVTVLNDVITRHACRDADPELALARD